MRPDLRQLATFVRVAETGSLPRAADLLHQSPSALSMQLGALQQRLGLQLFERTGRGLRLTPDGERLLPDAREALAAADRVAALAEGLGRGHRPAPVRVAIGTILDPGFIRLGEFLRAVHAHPPQPYTELRHGTSGWVMRELREGRLDFGFYLGQADAEIWRQQPLAPVRYVVIAPRGWERQLHDADWSVLARLPWIGTPRDSVHHRLLEPVWRSVGGCRQQVASVDQEASMLDLVRAGVGLSLAREAVALREAHETGLCVSRSHALDTHLSVMAMHERAAEQSVQALFEAARQIWRIPDRPR